MFEIAQKITRSCKFISIYGESQNEHLECEIMYYENKCFLLRFIQRFYMPAKLARWTACFISLCNASYELWVVT